MGDHNLRFELSEEPIWAGPVTRGVNYIATCHELNLDVRKTRGSPNGDLARLILKQTDIDPQTLVEIRRGETLCFHPHTLEYWANLTVGEGGCPITHFQWKNMGEVNWGDADEG